jgi:hypothetical protein
MIRFKVKKQNYAWLGGLGLLTVFALLSPNINPLAGILFIGALGVAIAGTLMDISDSQNAIKSISERVARSRSGQSPQALEAEARAKNRPQYRPTAIRMLDVGIIATQTSDEGISMRRARVVSKDDDGIRPFITLSVPSNMVDRQATIRFEMTDHSGKDQYIHEMRVFLRDGDMNILAENHLPMMENVRITGMGEWDLRVYVDGNLMGVHDFNHTLSQFERRQRLSGGKQQSVTESDGEVMRAEKRLRAEDLNVPLSLEELIRQQSDKKQGSAK